MAVSVLARHGTKSVALERLPIRDLGGRLGNADLIPIELAYQYVPWFYRAIETRAQNTPTIPYGVYRTGADEPIATEKEPEKVPAIVDIFHLIEAWTADLDMYGKACAWWQNGEWVRLHPRTITPEYDRQTGEIKYWTRRIDGASVRIYPDEPFLWLVVPPRAKEVGEGVGAGVRALLAATSMHNMDQYEANFWKNGAKNDIIVEVPDWFTLTETEQEREKRGWISQIRSWLPKFTSKDTKIHQLNQNMKDLAMDALTAKQRQNIAVAFGLPMSVIFSDAANFATAAMDDWHIYDKTLVPFVRTILAPQLNKQLLEPNGYVWRVEEQRLEVYQQYRIEMAMKLFPARQAGDITQDEFREALGYAPLTNVDDDWVARQREAEARLQSQEDSITLTPKQTDSKSVDDELATWERMARKRYREGNPTKALDFASDVLDAEAMDVVGNMLVKCDDAEQLAQVFADAKAWLAHA